MYSIDRSDSLAHHGIKGQKWGIRRYQNPDGSLTSAGRKRYGVDSSGNMSEKGKNRYIKDQKNEIGGHAIGKGAAIGAGIFGAAAIATGIGMKKMVPEVPTGFVVASPILDAAGGMLVGAIAGYVVRQHRLVNKVLEGSEKIPVKSIINKA